MFTKVSKLAIDKLWPKNITRKDKSSNNNKDLASKKQHLDINRSINNNFLNIKKIGKNSYKELRPNFDKKRNKNLELESIINERINKNP